MHLPTEPIDRYYATIIPVQIFYNPPVVLLSFISRFALVRYQIDSITTGSQKNIWASNTCLLRTIPTYAPRLFIGATQPNFSLRSSRNRVDLILYEKKTTDKREQYDWMAEKNLDGQ